MTVMVHVNQSGHNGILIEFHGKIDINFNRYNVKTVLIVKMDNNSTKIINQILEIYI